MRTNLNEPLKKIFKKSARMYRMAFPELKHNILLTDEEPIYVPLTMKFFFKDKPGLLKALTKYFTSLVIKNNASGVCEKIIVSTKELTPEDYNKIKETVILLKNDTETPNVLTVNSLDHEYGHILTHLKEDKLTNLNSSNETRRIHESKANAFALLMHIKRFGRKSDSLESILFKTSSYIIKRPDYYTLPANQATFALSRLINVEKLSIKDIAWYAREIGAQFALTGTCVKKITDHYDPSCLNKNNGVVIRGVYKKTIEGKNDSDIFRAGAYMVHNFALYNKKLTLLLQDDNELCKYHNKYIGDFVHARDEELGYSSIRALIDKKAKYNKQHKPIRTAISQALSRFLM